MTSKSACSASTHNMSRHLNANVWMTCMMFLTENPCCFCNLSVRLHILSFVKALQGFFPSRDWVLILKLIPDAVNCSKKAPPALSAFTCLHYPLFICATPFNMNEFISLFSFRMTHIRWPEMFFFLPWACLTRRQFGSPQKPPVKIGGKNVIEHLRSNIKSTKTWPSPVSWSSPIAVSGTHFTISNPSSFWVWMEPGGSTAMQEDNYLSKQKDEIAFLTKKEPFIAKKIQDRVPMCEMDACVSYEPNTITRIKNKICCPYKSLQRGKEISFQYELSF